MTKREPNEQDHEVSVSELTSQRDSMKPIFDRWRHDAFDQLDDVDWSSFQFQLSERLSLETEEYLSSESPSLDVASDFLRQESSSQVDAVDWSSFQSQLDESIRDRVVQELEQEFEPDLAAWKESALAPRAGQWSAFTQQVVDAVHREQVKSARLPLPEQTVEFLRDEIENSLDVQEPRFERDFFAELQTKIQAEQKSLREKLLEFLAAFFRPVPWAWGSAALALAVTIFIVSTPSPSNQVMSIAEPEHRVLVEAVQFEGTVTLSQSEELTVIWLASAS